MPKRRLFAYDSGSDQNGNPMNIRFSCPVCDYPGDIDVPGHSEWQCPRCDHLLHLSHVDSTLPSCAVCGNGEVYKKKDFPHSLGMGILVSACLASTVTYWLYDMWMTWTILLGSAAFDGLLYLWVKDVIVCYRCNAHFRGVAANTEHKPFELTIHERFRQERLRREQLK
jgi:ribosomal protein L37AE/L43A